MIHSKLNLWQRLVLRVRGRVFVRYEWWPGCVKPVAVWVANCSEGHGLFQDYVHGWKQVLECPKCLKMRLGIKEEET